MKLDFMRMTENNMRSVIEEYIKNIDVYRFVERIKIKAEHYPMFYFFFRSFRSSLLKNGLYVQSLEVFERLHDVSPNLGIPYNKKCVFVPRLIKSPNQKVYRLQIFYSDDVLTANTLFNLIKSELYENQQR